MLLDRARHDLVFALLIFVQEFEFDRASADAPDEIKRALKLSLVLYHSLNALLPLVCFAHPSLTLSRGAGLFLALHP